MIDAHLGWEVRVGVHAGPVVAGVVGQERYQFDIWGDTVNVAARMATKGGQGGVALTEDIWNHVSADFHGEPLGDLEVKGKGTITVFEAVGAKSRMIGRLWWSRQLVYCEHTLATSEPQLIEKQVQAFIGRRRKGRLGRESQP